MMAMATISIMQAVPPIVCALVAMSVDLRRADDAAAARKSREDSYARRLRRAVTARTSLMDEARKHLDAGTEIASLDDNGIKKAVIEKLCPGAKLDGKSADQIAARYEAEIERAASAAQNVDSVRGGLDPAGNPLPRVNADSLPDPDAARARMIEAQRVAAAGGKK